MSKFDDFYNYAKGKVFDTNGNVSSWTTVNWNWAYDGQCVSLIKAYLKYLGYGVKAYGNAIDFWTNRNGNGILNVCNVASSPQNGDIVVSAGGDPQYGHIFIYYNGQALTQNCCNNPRATVYPLSYQGTIYGYLRPKCLTQTYNASQLQSETGVATFTVDNVIVRRDSPTGADIGRRYKSGDKVTYTEKWVGNGHRYISWVEGSVRLFAAVSGSETQGVSPWATFSAVQSQPTTVTVDPSQFTAEEGIATLNVDIGVIARKNSPTGEKVRTYQNGASIPYDWKWVGNGHRYIIWKEGNDYIFLAVSGTEKQGEEPWATFSAKTEDPTENPSEGTNKPITGIELIEQPGTATFRNDVALIVRKDAPDGTDTGRRMTKGQRQEYTWIYIGNGHRYIVWEESGVKYFCAVTGTEDIPESGSDNEWAILTNKGEELPDVEEGNTIPFENPNSEIVLYKPTEGWLEKFGIKLVQNIVPRSSWENKCPLMINPVGISTHNAGTDTDPSARGLSDGLITNPTEAKSWHLTVDESTIVQSVSLDRNCFANADFSTGYASKHYLSIEICRDMKEENNELFLQAEKVCAILSADLMYQYGWDKTAIKKHQDWDILNKETGEIYHKYCPHKTLDLGWDRYVNMVMDYLEQLKEFVKENEPSTPDEPTSPSEEEKPDDNGEAIEGEKVNVSLLNKILEGLLWLIDKLKSIFK